MSRWEDDFDEYGAPDVIDYFGTGAALPVDNPLADLYLGLDGNKKPLGHIEFGEEKRKIVQGEYGEQTLFEMPIWCLIDPNHAYYCGVPYFEQGAKVRHAGKLYRVDNAISNGIKMDAVLVRDPVREARGQNDLRRK